MAMKNILTLSILLFSIQTTIAQTFDTILVNLPGVSNSSVAWGDYDNDGDLDFLLNGYSPGGRFSKIYKNDGSDNFTEQTGISLTGIRYGSVDWGDYDNDGDLDILLTGQDENYKSVAKIYKNNNGISFTEQTSIVLTGVLVGYVDWGDYDN